MVVHFDERLAVEWEGVKGDFRVSVRELEGVLEKVGQGSVQQRSVASDGHALRYGVHHQATARCVRFEACSALGIFDERCDGEDLSLRQRPLAHLVHCAVNEQPQSRMASFQHRAGRASHAQVAKFQRTHRDGCSRKRIPQLMYQKADAFSGLVRVGRQQPGVALGSELQHGVRDGVVEASIQRAELIDGKGGVALKRQVRDGLAEISIVVNDLVDVYPRPRRLAPCAAALTPISDNASPSPPDAPEIPMLSS